MTPGQAIIKFLRVIPYGYPQHMLCFFAMNAANGKVLPFLEELANVLARVDTVTPGYCEEMVRRLAAITGTGEDQYEAILQILTEIYVTGGALAVADVEGGQACFAHEPGPHGGKNPECELRIAGQWCAIEVKTPKLIAHRNARAKNPLQLTARLPKTAERLEGDRTLPRDNPVKDFLLSADAKFADYESYRAEALRVLVIVWDDFCNEPIAALLNENAGLLTPNSFCRDPSDAPVTFPNVDGIIVIRHQHQLLHSTRCEPLIDDLEDAFGYHHDGFPPKAFITVPGGRPVPDSVLRALNAVPLSECMGAEYRPTDLVMWFGGSDDSDS